MKKMLLLAFLASTFSALRGQDWSGKVYVIGKIYPGYYVTNAGDTVHGYFYHGNQSGNQQSCIYYKNEMDTRATSTFKPEDITSYMMADKLYRSIHYSGGLLDKPLRFNLVTKDGAITEFNFYDETGARETDGSWKYDVVYYKAGDANNPKPETMQYFGIGFAKKMSEYVADDADLSKKVSDKEKGYGMLQIDKIIEEYNTWYKTNH